MAKRFAIYNCKQLHIFVNQKLSLLFYFRKKTLKIHLIQILNIIYCWHYDLSFHIIHRDIAVFLVYYKRVIFMKLDVSALCDRKLYIVGVSGGVDSMALLDMLHQQGYSLHVCHVNYHLRHDSDEDMQVVQSYCLQNQIPYSIKEVNKESYQKGNFQNQARVIRYTFFYTIGRQVGTDTVLIGHHLDDQLETVYMQQSRNINGLLGIQSPSYVHNMTIIRPLLQVCKQELYAYCQDNKIPYHEDYTNFQTDFTRDYVRNVIMGTLTQQQKQELLATSAKHNAQYKKLCKEANKYFQRYDRQGYINIAEVPEYLLETIIYYMIQQKCDPTRITKTLIQEIIKQIYSTKPNIQVSLPLNILFIKEYDNIYISKLERKAEYCLKYGDLVYDKHDYFSLRDHGPEDAGVYLSRSDFPITIRSSQPGDTIVTSGGRKKIARLFINAKVPKHLRQTWPIVTRRDGTIVLVPLLAKNINYLYLKPNLFVIK